MIRVVLPILQKQFELMPQFEKLEEEVIEVSEAIADIFSAENIGKEHEMYEHLTSEVIDVMQVCVGILDNIERKYPGMSSKIGKYHARKLRDKNYKFKSFLVLEND